MKKFMRFSVLGLSTSLMFFSCGKEYVPDPAYEGCCPVQDHTFIGYEGTRPYYIYIPSAFTPNGDGINDRFYPQQIDSLMPFAPLAQQTGYAMSIFDSLDNSIAYVSLTDLNVPLPQRSWNGVISGTNGQLYKGRFKYRVIVAINDLTDFFYYEGTGCSILCGEGNRHLLDNSHCLFSSHGNNNGTFTPRNPRDFENLNCFK